MDEETQTQTTPQNTEPAAPDTAAQDGAAPAPAAAVACHAKRKKLTRKTKKTLLSTTFKSVFYYL